ncbi:RraA family protein [Paenibacillus thalictri]|uniref:Putative 4-hydroxy-4-methyl-2-oxoglutarate aldolase n=1 Tax=Paenibacillus thalictri TaxID=2527873 RepID=A0A4Q9DLS4_9BACL|nr:RraA family protein [Paenibacillus thalictri]TBL73942.1 RraA family protein [Paenibacillus thalictri]
MSERILSHSELLQLKRWNTPTVYNGWEQITKHDRRTCFNLEETKDYMPHMGMMIGYAVTVVCEPSNPDHQTNNPDAPAQCREYIASIPGPKIVVVQDLDKPYAYGSYWGEVGANIHRSLGCVGTITDGAVRDLDEMNNAGFKAIAAKMCVGHAYSWPVRWNCEVEVFGTKIQPGQLIHADKHGFLVIPEEDQQQLLEAVRFMDTNECDSVIAAGRNVAGKTTEQVLQAMNEAGRQFGAAAKQKYGKQGEW